MQSGLAVDALINNAGFGLVGRFWELDEKTEVDMLTLNVTLMSVYYASKAYVVSFSEALHTRLETTTWQ